MSEQDASRLSSTVTTLTVPSDPKNEAGGEGDHAADGLALLPFARELKEVTAQIEQGAAPTRYQRLREYHDALYMAQAVIVAFQRQRAGDGGEPG